MHRPTSLLLINERLVSLSRYGEDIVSALLRDGYKVICRPHGTSFKNGVDGPVIERIRQRPGENPDFTIDSQSDYSQSYAL